MMEKFVSGMPGNDPAPRLTPKEALEKHAADAYKESVRRRIRAPREGTPTPEDAKEITKRMLGEKD